MTDKKGATNSMSNSVYSVALTVIALTLSAENAKLVEVIVG
jgi:hypothetical protein